MANTEKPTTKAESKKLTVETPKKQKIETLKEPLITADAKPKEEEQKDEKKEKSKPKPSPKKAVKKEEVVVNGKSLSISTKYAKNICRFIKGKKIDAAIDDLEMVIAKKKSVPMKGEIPHRKGPGKIGSGAGRFPKKASESFVVLLKSLQANALNHDVDEPVITEANANLAQRPYGRGGLRRKRTHVTIKAREKKAVKKKSKKKIKNKTGGKKK